MVIKPSILTIICIFSYLFIDYIYCNDEIIVEDSFINKTLSDCRLKVGQDVFYCLRNHLRNYRKLKYGDSNNFYYISYYTWLLTLPNLSPNSVIYNQEPLEVDQSKLYENNYLDEPKFAPMFYKIDFNEYYDHMNKYIRLSLDRVTPRSRFRLLKDKLNDLFKLPKFVIEAISSHTTSFSEIFRVEMIGDYVTHDDRYSRSLLLFLDYYYFRPLLTKAFIFKFFNRLRTLYKLRFYSYCRRYSKKFKRYKTLIKNKNYLIKVTDLSNYFDIAKRRLYPFTPLPFVEDDEENVELPLEFTSVYNEFNNLIKKILEGLRERRCVNFLFKLLDIYSNNLYKIEDLKTIPVLNSFYILEVTPRSFGYSFYNIFPPNERKLIINYKDSFLVSSHVSKLDSNHRVIQIFNKFLISVPLMLVCTLLAFVYVVKFVE